MKKYKVLKLVTGEDIIGATTVDPENNAITIFKPLNVLTTTLSSGSTVLYLRSYLALPLNDRLTINNSHILSSYTPNTTFIDFYETMLQYIESFSEPETKISTNAANLILKEMIEKKLKGETDKSIFGETSDEMITPRTNKKVTH